MYYVILNPIYLNTFHSKFAATMPPKRTFDGAKPAGRPKGSKSKPTATSPHSSADPFASSDEEPSRRDSRPFEEEEEEPPEKTIPADLLTRLLHEFFEKDATRVSRDANAAVGKYVDVFVREAIARTAVEKRGGFLEVEDLEKATPQLMLDL